MNWMILILAGIFEIGWAIALKYPEGFTRLWPTVAVAASLLTGCVASGPWYWAASVPEGQALIYVYRPHRTFQIAAGYPNVYIDGKISHSLKNQSHGVSTVTPGRHDIKISGSALLNNWMLPDATIAIDAKAGARIYIRYVPEVSGAYAVGRVAGVTGASNLSEIAEKDAANEINQTRRSE